MVQRKTDKAHELISSKISYTLTIFILLGLITSIYFRRYEILTGCLAVSSQVTGLVVSRNWKKEFEENGCASKEIYINTKAGSILIFLLILITLQAIIGILPSLIMSTILSYSHYKLVDFIMIGFQKVKPIGEEDPYFKEHPKTGEKNIYKEEVYLEEVQKLANNN